MIVYFHIDELNRDAITASALKKRFKDCGHRLVYGNRLTFSLLKYFHRIFDVIIIPRPHFLYDHFKDKWLLWNSKFVTLSNESIGVITNDKELIVKNLFEKEYFENTKKYVDKIDAFCLWGKKQLEAIKEHAPEIYHKSYLVGHPRYDNFCLKYSHFNYDKLSNKNRIGIITRAVSLNENYGRPALEFFKGYFNENYQYEYYNVMSQKKLLVKRPTIKETSVYQSIDAFNTINIIKYFINKKYKISIRVHPKENLDTWIKIIGKFDKQISFDITNQPITNWLQDIDYVIGPPSTVFYDALISNVTPISISELDPRRKLFIPELAEDNNSLMPHIFKPKNIEEIFEFINKNKKIEITQEVQEIFHKEAGFPDCKDSLKNIVKVCEEVFKGNASQKIKIHFINFYLFIQIIHSFAWNIKSFFTKRKLHSAMFSLDFKTIKYIDRLHIRKVSELN